MTNGRRIYVDIDDVLSRTIESLIDLLDETHGRRVAVEDVRFFDLEKSFDLSVEQIAAFMDRAHAGSHGTDGTPLPEHGHEKSGKGAQCCALPGKRQGIGNGPPEKFRGEKIRSQEALCHTHQFLTGRGASDAQIGKCERKQAGQCQGAAGATPAAGGGVKRRAHW